MSRNIRKYGDLMATNHEVGGRAETLNLWAFGYKAIAMVINGERSKIKRHDQK